MTQVGRRAFAAALGGLTLSPRDLTNIEGTNQLHRDLKRLTLNDCVMEHPFERFKVWPTNADRLAFEAVLHPNGSPGTRHAGQRLAQCYGFMRSGIATFFREHQGLQRFSSPAELLFETLRRHLQFVVIELEQDDDPQVIFETLNARGVPLLPSDLVRNFVQCDFSSSAVRRAATQLQRREILGARICGVHGRL